MKGICIGIVVLLLSLKANSQFTEIPTSTTVSIGELAISGDTLILLGYPNYFAKYCITSGDLTVLSSPGIAGYANVEFQIVDGNYYLLSKQVGSYDHNYILKSSDFGVSWDTLFHTSGLFYTLSMADSTFGVLGGSFGSHAITDGSDTAWSLDTIVGGIFTSSAIYGDSTAIIEGTSTSFLTQNRTFSWTDAVSAPFGTPRQTQFLSKDTIFSLSNYGSGGGDTYFRRLTFDGTSWTSVGTNVSPCSMNLADYNCNATVYFMQINHDGTGFVLGYVESYLNVTIWQGEVIDKTAIFYTEDFGTSWTSFVTEWPERMYCMAFTNDSLAFIAGEDGLLYKWDLTIPLSNVLEINESDHESQAINFFPNPVSVDATLVVDHSHLPVTLVVTDQLGRIVQTEFISSESTTISFESLPDGIYYYFMGEIRGQFVVSK